MKKKFFLIILGIIFIIESIGLIWGQVHLEEDEFYNTLLILINNILLLLLVIINISEIKKK